MKWFQIHKSPISWAPKQSYKLWIINSINTINGDFSKKNVNVVLSTVNNIIGSFYCECTSYNLHFDVDFID